MSVVYDHEVFAKQSLATAGQASKQVPEPGLLAILGHGLIAVELSQVCTGKMA